jgi:hypothetical protein
VKLKYHMNMNIDERLEKLTARHEARAQTVEIIAGMQRENEKRMGQVLEAIAQLSHIAESHDHRLDNLEDRPH